MKRVEAFPRHKAGPRSRLVLAKTIGRLTPQDFGSARQNARSRRGPRLLEWTMHPASTPSIHGHEVMEAMQASGRLFTRESLAAFIVGRFGVGSRFHTCSAEGMTAIELVNFLADRGKFAGTEEGFALNPERVCQH